MAEQSQIVDLSGSCNAEILETVEKLLDESDFSKFTIVLKREPKKKTDLLITSAYEGRKNKTKYSVNTHHKPTSSDYSFKLNGPFSERMDNEDDTQDNYKIALNLYAKGAYEQALEMFIEQQHQLASSLKEGADAVKTYHDICFNIANCHYRLKNYEKAIDFFGRKFQGEDLKQQGQKFNNLGSCYAQLDQERLSLNYYTQAFKIYSQFPEIDCSNLLNNLGTLYGQSGVYDTAEKYFLQSIQERKRKSPQSNYLMFCSYMKLGSCQKNAKKYLQSIQTFKNALRLTERGYGDMSQTLMQLANSSQLCEKWNQALNYYQKLSVTSKRKGFLYQKAAHLHRNMGHFSDYDRLIKQAFEEYTKQRDERKLSELRPVLNRMNNK